MVSMATAGPRAPGVGPAGAVGGQLALGQVAWTVQEVALGLKPADLFPSYPDLGYLAAVPLAVAGLLRLPGAPRSVGAGARSVLDGLLIAGSLLFVSWAIVLGPVYANSPEDVIQKVIGLAYPVSDIAIATILILILSRIRIGARMPLALLGLGVLLNTFADSGFAYFTTVQSYATNNPIDVGWMLGYSLIGLAALRANRAQVGVGEDGAQLPRWNVLLPYVPVLGAAIVAVVAAASSRAGLLAWAALFIVAVVLARQFLLLNETRRLNAEVRHQNSVLDQLVAERTQALYASLEDLHRSNDERRQLLLRLVTMQEEEWHQIADVIHDDMLQAMIAAKMQVFLLNDPSATPETLSTAVEVDAAIDKAVVRMRGLMSELRPQVLDMGLPAALQQCLEELSDEAAFRYVLRNGLENEPDPTIGTTLFRFVREALNNIRKHARGAMATVELLEGADGFCARVSDDGPGFAPQADGRSPAGHRGLSAMRERADALGGRVTVRSEPGRGTTLECWLPHRLAHRTESLHAVAGMAS